ncbi:hypothetical protein [Mesorhizobium mediterraneum]|uniref:hypothetical protein n=1 Tax=Mesorhizobium mediterraneum TaxID=43617 RepID=UPI00177F1115|nr:hypothetical protein [Mesorhizobium mediterraneum]
MPVVRKPDGTLVHFPDAMPRDQIHGMESGAPIEVELPDGTIAEFPAGTSHETMRTALQRKFPMQDEAGPSSKGPRFPGIPEEGPQFPGTVENGPWTKYRQQALDELNRRKSDANAGPWTKYQNSGVTPEQAQTELDRRRGARQFEITAPNGKKYRVTGDSQEGAIAALKKHIGASPVTPSHPEFDGSNMPGYNPETGTVEHTSAIDKVGAFSTGGLQGVPIVGPYLDKASSAVAAAMAMPFSDKSFSELYDRGNRYSEDVRGDNPNTALAGNVVGSVAGTLPAIAAAPQAFGAGTAPLAVRSAVSALTGAGIGGADAAVRSGGNPTETRNGALLGALTGGLAPSVAGLLGAGYRATADFISKRGAARIGEMTPAAISQLSKAMEADGIPASEIQQRLAQLGPEATLADLGPNLQQMAAGLVAKPGPARSIVQDTIRRRDAGANSRITGALDDTLGPAPVPSQIDAGIRANQRSLSPAYEDAFRNARAVDTQQLADTLDSQIVNLRGDAQAAARHVRDMLNIHGTGALDPHPGALFQTRQAIDGMLDGATDGNVRRVLSSSRQMVDDQLARSVPGIKDIDSRFAELARQREGLERGQAVLDSGRTSPRPQELADEVLAASQPQGRMIGPSAAPLRLREGARAELDRIVGTNANDRVALQRLIKGEGDWNAQKLATLFGADRAQRILSVLDAERTFADTSNFVTRNSATAARQEALRSLGGDAGQGFGVREGYMAGGTLGAARSAGVRTVERIIEALRGASTEANHSAMARGLVSNGQSRIAEALMRGVRSQGPSPEVIALARALMIGGPASGLVAPVGAAVSPLINNAIGR